MIGDQVLTSHELETILDENSFKKYDCEFQTHFSNHLAHGIIALYRINASKEQVLNFIAYYSKFLNSPKESDASSHSIEELRGNRVEFDRVLEHYNAQLSQGVSWNTLLNSNFQSIYKGMIGSLMHPLISVGYGVVANSAQTVCDGIAFMHYAYFAKEPADAERNFGNGNRSIFEVLQEIKEDTSFRNRVKSAYKLFNSQINNARFKIFGVLFNEESEYLTSYVNQIKLPEIIFPSSIESVRKCADSLLDISINIYLRSEIVNEFFLLHIVTGCYALKHILYHLEDFETAKDSLRVFIECILCVYISENCPYLDMQLHIPIYENLDGEWKSLTDKLLSDITIDEHVFKLVQVCKEFCEETNCEETKLNCLMAAKMAVENKLAFQGNLYNL